MPDDLRKRRPRDNSRINLGQRHEIEYWCRRFKCTEQELEDAVRVVGDSAASVRQFLIDL